MHGFIVGGMSFSFNPRFSQKPVKTVTIEVKKQIISLLPPVYQQGEKLRMKSVKSKQRMLKNKDVISENNQQKPVFDVVQKSKIVEQEMSPSVLGSDNEMILRYHDVVKQKIEHARRYPYFAKQKFIEGTVHLKFCIHSDGTPTNVEIIKSSGYVILDREAVETIRRASPFPAIPDDLCSELLSMSFSLIFKIKHDF